MRYGSVCSGIEAATVAWHPLGWKPAFFSEIDKFPRAVLAHHYPHVPLHGDFTTIRGDEYEPIDLLVGGTPCQSFSIAGLRGGMADPRGNLALAFLQLARRTRARWLVWENVPGVLSSNGGRDFGSILGGMVELGYGIAYRVLDAQFFGVPQRRRRVFVVGYLGDWRRAAAVLFERESLRGDPPPRREARKYIAPTISARPTGGGGLGTDFDLDGGLVAKSLNAHPSRIDYESETFVTHSLRADGFDASEDGTGRGTPLVPVCFSAKDHGADAIEDLSPTLRAGGHTGSHANAGVMPAIAFNITPSNSNKDYNAREAWYAQAITGNSNVSARGGDIVIGCNHANAAKTGPREALRAMLEAAGEEETAKWCLGILAAFWPAEVLRPEVHGRGVRCTSLPQRGLVNIALSRSQDGAAWTVQDLWEAGCNGRAPQGWGPHEQRAGQLGAYLSQLPYTPSPAERFLHDMWGASEGAGLLRQALSAVQNARRPACGKNKPAHANSAVRRLTVEECEALQGFPRSYTLIPYRNGMAADGPRYKALGNSMAVPVMRWIGERIQAVENITQEKAA